MPTPSVGISRSPALASPIVVNPPRSDIVVSFPRLLLLEGRVEGLRRGGEVHLLDEGCRLGRAVRAIHAAIFPFHRERALVADAVERADDCLELHAAPAQRAEVPAAPRVAEVEMRAQD